MTDKYKRYSQARKKAQLDGTLPEWYSTAGYQLVVDKYYIDRDETVKQRYLSIAETLANHLPIKYRHTYYNKFFNLLWEGYLSPATPVFTNVGKPSKGMPISCSGSYVYDSVDGFYSAAHEIAMMSKNGFGTSAYLGDIRPRGSITGCSLKTDGVVPVLELMYKTAKHISQGSNRRGSIACYLPVSHDDFWEVCHYLENNSSGANFGWCFTDEDIAKLEAKDDEATRRYQEILYLRMLGIGYIFLSDNANRQNPEVYNKLGLKVNAPQLCNEIMLYNNKEHSYTCCLSSLNLVHWDKMKADESIIFDSIVFLDCVNSEFIKQSEGIPGLQRARNFAMGTRPVGLGVMGYSTYLQANSIIFDSLQGHLKNKEIFKTIRKVANDANEWLGKTLGEPDLMKGSGLRCSHLLAVAPTLSTAIVMGGVSNGIEPFYANVYTAETSAGEIKRANPELVKLLKSKGLWSKEVIDSIANNSGSVSHLKDLTDHEKAVFRTAFEVNQPDIIRQAESRQEDIDQGQSLNLFVSDKADEELISYLHKLILTSKKLKGAYYVRSTAGVNGRTTLSEQKSTCTSCEG